MVETTLHDFLELDLEGLDGTDIGRSVILVQAVDVQRALVDVGNVVVLEVQDLLGVLDNRRWVGGEEELGGHWGTIVGEESTRLRSVEERLVWGSEQVVGLLQRNVVGSTLSGESGTLVVVLNIDKVDLHLLLCPHTNDKGRTLAGSHNLMGIVDRLDKETKGTLELLDDSLDERWEAQVWVLSVDVLCELGNGLGICLRLELEALALKQGLEFLVVCDDSVVDDGKLPVGVRPGRGWGVSMWACSEESERTYLWGWQLTREGGPWVAHRVWAIPACESKTLLRSKFCSSTSFFNEATLPTSLTA